MNQKRVYKSYPKEFKEEAVALVTDQGYTVVEAAKSLGILIRTGFPRHFLDSLNIVVHTPLAGHDHYACVGALGCRTSRYN